jgi:integrase
MHELIEQFLRTYQARLKPSTFLDYRSILRHHISHFENFEALNKDFEEYLAQLPCSGKRKNNILSATRSFVGWVRRRDIWSGNFYQIPRFPWRGSKIKPLSPEEARLVMTYAPYPYRDYFQLSILTGVRTGESLGLQFDDFDLVKRKIIIRRAYSCGQIVTTKTASGEREIPLLRPIWEIYQRRSQENEMESPWFFYSASPKGGIISRQALRKAWRGILEAFDIDPRPLYATRHTYASLAIAAGEDPLWVARTMGHSRPDQLFLKYASYLEEVKKDGEKILELVMGRPSLMRVIR